MYTIIIQKEKIKLENKMQRNGLEIHDTKMPPWALDVVTEE